MKKNVYKLDLNIKSTYLCRNKNEKHMKTINTALLSDNNTFKFELFKSELVDQVDVFHKGNRVAILNGIDGAALRWVATADKISIKAVIQLEKMVARLIKQSIKLHLANA
jgi:spermidine synthase